MAWLRARATVALLPVCLLSPWACGQTFTSGATSGGDGGAGGVDAPSVDGSSSSSGSSSSGGGDGAPPQESGPLDATQPGDGPVPGDASVKEGSVVEGGLPTDASFEEAAPPGNVVYVSATTGNDANDGTDPTAPKKTIASAIARAGSIVANPEVHVCKGTYVESSLGLTSSINLRGAYDCTTWKRTTAFGFPTFDKVDQTVIQNAAPAAQAATLLVTGGVDPGTIIDGLLIEGAANFSASTLGVQVAGSASPTLQDDVVTGGGGVGASGKQGSVGVAVTGGSPEVTHCVVSGGSGTGTIGSTGIVLASTGTPYVHDAVVSGGTGTAAAALSDLAAVGMLVTNSMSQAQALKNLVVTGSDDGATGGPTVGISIYASGVALNVDLLSSAIKGGDGAGGGTVSVAIDIADPGGSVKIAGDRVYGGTRTGGGLSYGVFATTVGVLTVNDDEVHAGESAGSVGVSVAGATSASVAFDTIYVGANGGSAIAIDTSQQGVVVTDDLLIGSDASTGAGVNLGTTCGSGQLATLDHTAFMNFGILYSCGAASAQTVTTMAAELPGVSTAGDIQIGFAGGCTAATSCVTDPSCPGTPATCVPSILGPSFTTSPTGDDGRIGLFSGVPSTVVEAGASLTGWTMANPVACAVARGGASYGGIGTDIFGQARNASQPTIGAFEYSAACQ